MRLTPSTRNSSLSWENRDAGTGPGRGWLAELDLPAAPPEIVTDWLAVIPGLAPVIERLDGELRQCYVAFTSRIAGPLRLSLGTRGWTHVRSS